MKRFVLLALLALVAEAFRLAVIARFPAHPDLLLGIVVLASLAWRPPRGAVAGLVLGVLRDLVQGAPAGSSALPLAAIGWAVGSLGRSVYREAAITQIVMLFGASLASVSVDYVVSRGGEVAGFFLYLVRVGLPTSVLTALVVPWLYRAALEAHRNRQRWRRSFFRRLRGYERKILVQR